MNTTPTSDTNLTWQRIEAAYTALLFEIFNSSQPAQKRLNLLGEFQQAFALAPNNLKQAEVIGNFRALLQKQPIGGK